jgi:hypothetical protein
MSVSAERLAEAFESCRIAIEASLPRLSEYLRFCPDKKSGGLRVESAVEGRLKFTQAEVAEITAAVEFKGGSIVTTGAGYYWLVSREALLEPPKASVAPAPVEVSKEAAQKVSASASASTESAPIAQSVPKQDEGTIASKDGKTVYALVVQQTGGVSLHVNQDLKLAVSVSPFQNFFVERVLQKMQDKDVELVRLKELTADKAFAYNIVQEKGALLEIVLRNFDAERWKELVGSLRWTFERMLEKMVQAPNDAKPVEQPKQAEQPKAEANQASQSAVVKQPTNPALMPSPPSLFTAENCGRCEAQKLCAGDPKRQVDCLEVQRLSALRQLAVEVGALHEDLKALGEVLKSLPLQRGSGGYRQPSRPKETVEEDGLIWTKVFDEGTSKLKWLKAYEKDNAARPDKFYYDLERWVAGQGKNALDRRPFLGVEVEVCLWVFTQGPRAIGKKLCVSRQEVR